MGVTKARHYLQVAMQSTLKPAFPIDHQGKFPQGHSMDRRDRKPADTGTIIQVKDRAIHIEPVRIRTVQYDNLLAMSGARFHQMMHSDIVGVIPQPDILDIDKHHIEIIHALLRCVPVGTIK